MSSKLKPWLLLGGIFVIGAVTGAALMAGLGAHFMHPPRNHDLKKDWMAHLTQELALTADQQAKIEPILTDTESKLHALSHDEKQRGAQIFKATDDQISALLTPDQQVKLQKVEEEREKLFGGHLHSFNHGGPSEQMPPSPPPQPEAATNAVNPQPPAH